MVGKQKGKKERKENIAGSACQLLVRPIPARLLPFLVEVVSNKWPIGN